MKKLIIQALSFFGLSGIGWLIDMTIYSTLTTLTNINVSVANMLSSLVAVTFVYITSTKKLFKNKINTFSVKKKYLFYIVYQIGMILLSSFTIGQIANFLLTIDIDLFVKFAKILAKILFTPVTMIVNFCFMKWLMEKV